MLLVSWKERQTPVTQGTMEWLERTIGSTPEKGELPKGKMSKSPGQAEG